MSNKISKEQVRPLLAIDDMLWISKYDNFICVPLRANK